MPEVNMFKYLLQKLGGPSETVRLSEGKIQIYKNILPSRLLYFWRENGIESYRDGVFWFCDPEIF